MNLEEPSSAVRRAIEDAYRTESRRVFATLVRLLGDFDLAEEALQEAFASAMVQWPRLGVPANPRAWLVSAGRFRGIDVIRRRAKFDSSLAELAEQLTARSARPVAAPDDDAITDDRLRLIFTCCHPALALEAQIALTLREVCGLTTDEVARAFLTAPATLAQRIVRAKAKIKSAGIPYEVPSKADWRERIDGVLHVIYLVFNEGYSASSGAEVTRASLSAEAIRLGRLLADLADASEVLGLLALMLLQESRRPARATPTGDIILLDQQDRSLWNRQMIEEGLALAQRALAADRPSAYTLQAAIAAVHANAATAAATDWAQIAALYGLLNQIMPSPVVELNRAVAIAMRDGPAAGLQLIDTILARGDLTDYHLAHSARADLCRRLGRIAEARSAYEQALALAQQEPERRFLKNRLAELAQ